MCVEEIAVMIVEFAKKNCISDERESTEIEREMRERGERDKWSY